MPRIASTIYLESQGTAKVPPWYKKIEDISLEDVESWEKMCKEPNVANSIPLPKDGFAILKQIIYKQGGACFECHWCAAKCTRELFHDDPPPVPFTKTKSQAKRPASPYCCRGCWLWRRQRLGITYLTGSWKDGRPRDGQTPANHSWWITPDAALALTQPDFPQLWELLCKPPKCFVLALVSPPVYFPNGQVDPKTVVGNWLHLAVGNDLEKVEMGTQLGFTINNVAHTYSVYELQNAFRDGDAGKEPGVQALIRFLGSPPASLVPAAVKEMRSVDRKTEPPAGELRKPVEAKK